MKYVTIPVGVLVELMTRESELNMLEAGGVEDWDWYDESFILPDGRDWVREEMVEYFTNLILSDDYPFEVVDKQG